MGFDYGARDRAVGEIKRVAVTQSPSVRREMLRMAAFFERGAELRTDWGQITIILPIHVDGELVAHSMTNYTLNSRGAPAATTVVDPWEG